MRLQDSSVAPVGERVNGMPRFSLCDVLELTKLYATGKVLYFTDVTVQDNKRELAHIYAHRT